MKVVASIDVGSNTLRLLIAEVKDDGSINILKKLNRIARLAEGLERNGFIKKEAMERTERVLCEFMDIAKRYGASLIRAVGTSALRESKNAGEFREKILKQLNLNISIITPEEEAKLTAQGVISSLNIWKGKAIVIDIGGGSTEFIQINNGEVKEIRSLKTGVVKLTEAFIKNHPTPESEIQELHSHLKSLIAPLKSEISLEENNLILIGTAGTVTNLAAMDLGMSEYKPDRINGHVLTKKRVEELIRLLSPLSITERRSIPGLESGREDVIIAGGIFVLTCLEVFGKDEILISDGGLLEGNLIRMILEDTSN